MDDVKKIQTGWIIVIVSVVVSFIVIGIFAPSVELTEACDKYTANGDTTQYEAADCATVEEEDNVAFGIFSLTCCLSSPFGIFLLVSGNNGRKRNAPQVVIQQVPYMMPAQPTYAVPQAQPVVANSLEEQLKKGRMQNVELLRGEGRYMEAALEAEQAGEYSYASELRKYAEDKLRVDHQPQSGSENTYLAYLTSALADGFLSKEEEQLLESQRSSLGVSWETHIQMLATAGYSHDQLKTMQNAKFMEDSGRFLESAVLYESVGSLDKAQMLRIKAKMMDNNQSNITYNITDSAVGGDVGVGGNNHL
jgi:hypothetical protein